MQDLIAQGCQVQLVKKSNTMWVFTKIAAFVSTIGVYVCSFFNGSLFSKMEPFVQTPDPLDIIKTVLQKQDETLEILALVCNNQTVLQNNIKESFKVLSDAILDLKKTLIELQNQAGIKPSMDLGPLQSTLEKLIAGQVDAAQGLSVIGQSLTRFETVGFPTKLNNIMLNQAVLKDQVLATGQTLGIELVKFLREVDGHVLRTPSETTKQLAQFLADNYELSEIATTALISS